MLIANLQYIGNMIGSLRTNVCAHTRVPRRRRH
jgi:hypothetical protein